MNDPIAPAEPAGEPPRPAATPARPTALIADDEPILRDRLRRLLGTLWPELDIVAEARNGREAIEAFESLRPQVAFLDVHMPGLSGVDAARAIARRAEVVFVTAHEQYAVEAFAHGALDYVVKPFDEERLADTVGRLQGRLAAAPRAPSVAGAGSGETGEGAAYEALLDRLAADLRARGTGAGQHLQWLRASVGNSVRLIPVEQVVFVRSDEKYTLVVWEGGEALIRKTIRELVDALDPATFAQIHRSVIVNLRHVAQVDRGFHDTAELRLKGRTEVLPVSRSFLHLFRQM